MKRDIYEFMYGKDDRKYGVYNVERKCFQFGICEDTPMLAQARLFSKIGNDARKWRFEFKAIPENQIEAVMEKQKTESKKAERAEVKRLKNEIITLNNLLEVANKGFCGCTGCVHRSKV